MANMSACLLELAVWMLVPETIVYLLMMQHMRAGLGVKQAPILPQALACPQKEGDSGKLELSQSCSQHASLQTGGHLQLISKICM